MLRYQFEYIQPPHYHYIKTTQVIGESEIKLLGEILAFFPHSYKSGNWKNKFSEFKPEKYPKNLLLLAANAYDSNGNTVLGVVAETGKNIDALKKLIHMRADIDRCDDTSMKRSPLFWAICYHQLASSKKSSSEDMNKSLKCLLDHGANYESKFDYYDCMPVEYAKRQGFTDVVETLKNFKKFKEQQFVLVFGLFDSKPSSLKTLSDDPIFDSNTVNLISEFMRPAK